MNWFLLILISDFNTLSYNFICLKKYKNVTNSKFKGFLRFVQNSSIKIGQRLLYGNGRYSKHQNTITPDREN